MDNDNNTIMIDSVIAPISTEYFWVLDLSMRDFTLAPLTMFEEITCKSIEVQVGGFRFVLPGKWNMLVMDLETSLLDFVEIGKLAGREFRALVSGPNKTMIESEVVITTDYFPTYVNVAPSLNKNQMMCHPISPDSWINVAPSDTYNKYLKECVAGDII